MGRKPRVDRSPEEKWQIVQEGIKSGNVSETCRRYGGAINYYHQDHLGVRLITDAGGNDVGEQGTFPFGEAWYQNNTTTQWTFTTYQRDSESGLDYALARYYDSRMGSFCSADPVEGDLADPESWNRYVYARDNPVSISDPRGQFIQFLVGLFEWLGYLLVQGAADTADFAAYLSFDFEANQQSFNGATQFTDFSGPPGGTGLEFWSGGNRPSLPQQGGKSDCNLVTPAQAASQAIHYRVAADAIGYFQPSFAQQLANGIWQLNSEGIIPTITSGFRTAAMQVSVHGSPFGAAQVSWHQQGLAADFGLNANHAGNINFNPEIHNAMTRQGLTWGGTFHHPPDPVHYQQPPAGSRSPGQLTPNCPTPKGGGA